MNIDVQLEAIWKAIGFDQKEIEDQYLEINLKVQDLFQAILKENYAKMTQMKKEAEEAEQQSLDIMEKFGIFAENAFNTTLSLRNRISIAQNKLEHLKNATSRQQREFDSAFNTLTKCFDTLEIENRGDFAEPGYDYSLERINVIKSFIGKMTIDIEERKREMDELFKELDLLTQTLGLEPIEKVQTLGEPTFQRLEEKRDDLQEHLARNQKKCKSLLAEINRCEHVLKLPQTPEPDPPNYSDFQIVQLKNMLSQLDGQKSTRIPEFVNEMKQKLLNVWKELHIVVPSPTDFPYVYSTNPNKRTLVALQAEVSRLETLKQQISPMLRNIETRNEIIRDYEKMQSEEGNSSRLTTRKVGGGTALIEEERIKQRYKVRLPKLNEQLCSQLQEYADTYGEPFLWDGENLLDQVKEMMENDKKIAEQENEQTIKDTKKLSQARTPKATKPIKRNAFKANKTII